MTRGKSKGSNYERNVCKVLSAWWTGGERDDVFWRTASSGGRATQRKKKNKDTFGQCGDVQAADPIGQPLIDRCIIEIKCGYNNVGPMDFMDKDGTESQFQKWVWKLREECKCFHVASWLLIHKRDRRISQIYFPRNLYKFLGVNKWHTLDDYLICSFRLGILKQSFYGMPFQEFMTHVDPEQFTE